MKPLIDETNDPLEQALLREARNYGASARAKEMALAAAHPWALGRAPWLKLAIGAGGVAIGAAVLFFVFGGTRPPAATSPSAPIDRAPTAIAPIVTQIETVAPAVTTPKIATVSPPTVDTMPTVDTTGAPRATAGNGSSLAEEIAIIDRARKAVYASNKGEAYGALDEYDRRFPQGALAPEAKTLRARADALR